MYHLELADRLENAASSVTTLGVSRHEASFLMKQAAAEIRKLDKKAYLRIRIPWRK